MPEEVANLQPCVSAEVIGKIAGFGVPRAWAREHVAAMAKSSVPDVDEASEQELLLLQLGPEAQHGVEERPCQPPRVARGKAKVAPEWRCEIALAPAQRPP